MADYIIVENYSKLGEMGISRKAIVSVTERAVNSVPGVSLKASDKKDTSNKKPRSRKAKGEGTIETVIKKVSIEKPIKVYLRSNGQAEIQIEVIIQNGLDIGDKCLEIQKAVSEALQMSCETIPFSVNVKVAKVG